MALKYHVVCKKDLRKEASADAKLYHGQIRAGDRITLDELSESISALSTASEGDISVVLDGLLMLMRQNLAKGNIVELGDLGNFHMSAGSPGVEDAEAFSAAMFRKGRIVYSPGNRLIKHIRKHVHYEKQTFIEEEDPCGLPHTI
ncbi:MAG: hypothetical protein LIP06_06625 [Tannerellaceae bacterium]|nr:hypothetical protein [Tannerellaceae bacterium]